MITLKKNVVCFLVFCTAITVISGINAGFSLFTEKVNANENQLAEIQKINKSQILEWMARIEYKIDRNYKMTKAILWVLNEYFTNCAFCNIQIPLWINEVNNEIQWGVDDEQKE